MPSLACFLASSVYLLSTTSAWRLRDVYDGNNWQQMFNIYNKGVTNYEFASWVPWADPALVQNRNGQLYLGIGHGSWIPPEGPYTMQLRSKAAYNGGLIIADFAHIPESKCGVWPSFWLNGLAEPWPAGGEIDLIEGVNLMSANQITIHSLPGCIPDKGTQFGEKMGEIDCGAGKGLVGCGAINRNSTSFGSGFNNAGGGVIAMAWDGNGIKIWQWTRYSVPSDVFGDVPNPSGWGTPAANWMGGCDFNQQFHDMQIILDTKFCGGWAGQKYVWPASGCQQRSTQSCEQYVRENWGSMYDGVYWLLNSIRVFQT